MHSVDATYTISSTNSLSAYLKAEKGKKLKKSSIKFHRHQSKRVSNDFDDQRLGNNHTRDSLWIVNEAAQEIKLSDMDTTKILFYFLFFLHEF